MASSSTKANIDTTGYDPEALIAAEDSETITAPHTAETHLKEDEEMSLSSVLTDDILLPIILEGFVGYALQDCRLVFRAWREACKQFPVEVKNMDTDELQCLKLSRNQPQFGWEGGSQRIRVAELLQHLSSLNNLTSLTLQFSDAYYDGSVPSCVQSMVQLTDLKVYYNLSGVGDDLIASINYLTSLTSLYLHASPPRHPLDSFIELQKIQDLDVNNSSFVVKTGAGLFPAFTNLTKLSFAGYLIDRKARLDCTEAVSIYASTLKVLVLKFEYIYDAHVDYASLPLLTNLQRLILVNSSSRSRDLVEVLPQLRSLTGLEMKDDGFLYPGVLGSIARCTGLKSLNCACSITRGRYGQDVSLVLHCITQLTEIAACCYGEFLADLSRLTLLHRLHLRIVSEEDCSLDEVL